MAFVYGIGRYQAVLVKIGFTFRDEFLVGGVGADARTKSFGKIQAFRISHIPPEKGPRAAHVGLDGVNDAAFPGPEEDAVSVFPGFDLPFAVAVDGIGVKESLTLKMQALVKALEIGGAEDNAAFPLAAVAAHAAVENGFIHIRFLIGDGVRS